MNALHPPRREKNGRRQRLSTQEALNEMNRREQEAAMAVVRAQPHRMGSPSPLRESALGRFVEAYSLASEVYAAGIVFVTVRGMWDAAIGAPRQERHGGSGGEIDEETQDKWAKQLADGRRAMRDNGGEDGMKWAMLLLEDVDLPSNANVLPVIAALNGLARAMGKM
jgi:hypothetical protein